MKIVKRIIPLMIGFQALTVVSATNPEIDRLTLKTKESKIKTFEKPYRFIGVPTGLDRKFVTGMNRKSSANFSILAWDLKVKFKLSRNMNIIFSYQ
jgi:hypothetical protein